MIWKVIIAFTLISFQSVFASSESIQKVWDDNSGKHTLIIEKGADSKYGGEKLVVKQMTEGSNDWVLKDYVRGCGEDIKLDIVSDSVEVKKMFSDGEGTVLFAYKIGCVGGIDPVAVKYFAYRDGIKYSLRGEEHIIVGNNSFGGEEPPVPDFNLKRNKPLLKYMMKKWKAISKTEIN